MRRFSITYSIADQNFDRTLSIGILNLSVEMLRVLARRPEVDKLSVLSNSTLSDRLQLPSHIPVTLHDSAVGSMPGRIRWDQTGAYSESAKLGHEWLFLPKGYASFIRKCPVKLATCMADASYDYYKKHYPKEVPRFKALYYDWCVRGSIKHSTIIFTISQYAADEVIRIAKEYRITPPPIIPIGIGFNPATERYEDKKPRVLVLAGRWPHKRTDLALKYLAEWQKRSDFQGTVEWVGKLPPGSTLPDFPRWIMHPRLPDPQFKRLQGEAKVLVYFSDYEGFGMPPVEAAIIGTCPVYSDLPATREVMATAGFSFDNRDYTSFERAMTLALNVSRPQIDQWGETLLRRYSPDSVIDRVFEGFRLVSDDPLPS